MTLNHNQQEIDEMEWVEVGRNRERANSLCVTCDWLEPFNLFPDICMKSNWNIQHPVSVCRNHSPMGDVAVEEVEL